MQHRTGYSSYFAALSLATLMMTGCGSSDNPVAPSDTVAPTVTSTNPINGSHCENSDAGVAIITATFSEAMMGSSLSAATFAVNGPGGTPITGVVTYNATTRMATFTPTSSLAASKGFTATITTGAKDTSGNSLANNQVWNFRSTPRSQTGSRDEFESTDTDVEALDQIRN